MVNMIDNILPKTILRSGKKALAGFMAGVLLFTSTVSWAGEEVRSSKLAPPLRTPDKEFRIPFKAGYDLLAHKAPNEYIAKCIVSKCLNKAIKDVTPEDRVNAFFS